MLIIWGLTCEHRVLANASSTSARQSSAQRISSVFEWESTKPRVFTPATRLSGVARNPPTTAPRNAKLAAALLPRQLQPKRHQKGQPLANSMQFSRTIDAVLPAVVFVGFWCSHQMASGVADAAVLNRSAMFDVLVPLMIVRQPVCLFRNNQQKCLQWSAQQAGWGGQYGHD